MLQHIWLLWCSLYMAMLFYLTCDDNSPCNGDFVILDEWCTYMIDESVKSEHIIILYHKKPDTLETSQERKCLNGIAMIWDYLRSLWRIGDFCYTYLYIHVYIIYTYLCVTCLCTDVVNIVSTLNLLTKKITALH